MIKEYFKAEYNLRGMKDSPISYDMVVLEKRYGRKIPVCEWIDNLRIDEDLDGGIDYIVIDIDGNIIPLVNDNEMFEKMEELLFDECDTPKSLNRELTDDEQIEMITKLISKKKSKITVDLLQLKSGNSFQERTLNKIKTTVDDLIVNEKYDSIRYSEKLISNIKLIKQLVKNISINDGAVEINFMYIVQCDSKPKSMPQHKEIANDIQESIIKGLKHSNVKVELLYGKEFINFLDENHTSNKKINILNQDTLYKKNSYCISLVKLTDLVSFVSIHNGIDTSLFDGNVRDSYKTLSPINKEIINTLTHEITTTDFWWLNNGITIICSSMNKKGNTLYVEEPQIVNGLQSVVAIYDTFQENNKLNSGKKIMVKILVENDSDNIDTIIRTTNTQNPVDAYLLSSTNPIHRDIEKYFLTEGYYYDRRKNYYKNLKKDKSKIFDIKYTFKTYSAIFLARPSQVRTATKKNFTEYNNNVFNDSINKLAYVYCDLLDRRIQKILRKSDFDEEFKNSYGVSIITYSLHLSYMYTILAKGTMSFNDKYINKTDIANIEILNLDNSYLQKIIEILNIIMKRYPNDNKVYLARSTKLENDIQEEMDKIIKREKNER